MSAKLSKIFIYQIRIAQQKEYMQEHYQRLLSQQSSKFFPISSISQSAVFSISSQTSRISQKIYKRTQQIQESSKKDSSFVKVKHKQFKINRFSSISNYQKQKVGHCLLPNFSISRQYFSTTLPPTIKSYAYCAMLSDTNQVISSNNSTIKLEIASLTKIMTAYTVIQLCYTFGIKIRDIYIQILKHSADMSGTTADLQEGEQINAFDLLYGLLLPSGNDAAIALAQHFGKMISFKFASQDQQTSSVNLDKFQQAKEFYNNEYGQGSIKLFVFQMNKNARKIGLNETHFANPTGLNNIKNYSTAKDIAKLTSICLKNFILKNIFKTKMHICQIKNIKLGTSRKIQWKNTNRLLYEKRQCIGVKTGITPNAGPCLCTVFKFQRRQLVIVVLKSQLPDQRYTDTLSIYRYCRKKLKNL